MASRIRTWDDYFIRGTTVLKNRLNIADAEQLQALENRLTLVRTMELRRDPPPPTFNYEHMKAIHRHLFQDVYEWAGQERIGPDSRMTKEGPDVLNYAPGDPQAPTVAYGYYPGPQVREAAEHQYRLLAGEQHLQGLESAQFVQRLAEYWGELNVIHSFREGNTRTQVLFFEQLAEQAGHPLDTSKLLPGTRLREEFVLARFYSQATGRADRLADVLTQALAAEGPAKLPSADLHPSEKRLAEDYRGARPINIKPGETNGPVAASRAASFTGHRPAGASRGEPIAPAPLSPEVEALKRGLRLSYPDPPQPGKPPDISTQIRPTKGAPGRHIGRDGTSEL